MTPTQTVTIAAIGGIAGVLGLVLFTALAVAVYEGIARLLDHLDNRRTITAARRQLDAMPTADEH